MNIKLTAVFQKVPEGYIGFVEELPGTNTQAATLKEARANLLEAVDLVIDANRTLAEESVKDQEVIGRVPTQADLDLKRKSDRSFPDKSVFRRWGNRDAMLAQVSEYCRDKPEFEAVSRLLDEGISASLDQRLSSFQVEGFVYLLRSGKHYKIGRTNASGRRLRELAIQLPQKPNTVHVIETDDPKGIEQYWHRRFDSKRQGGEWFALSQQDVRAFKKRRFQ